MDQINGFVIFETGNFMNAKLAKLHRLENQQGQPVKYSGDNRGTEH